ncbi:NAD(P)H-binding protein [Nonomuraea sp. NPDC050786]|uniref:NAD(P)H-binding protein n=1 Tax=Nonomuraea sp. NPDC050786 TaxID=3154840 RepID=UPI0033D3B3EA
MTILITGARGHVARSLVQQLRAAGAEVRAASRDPAASALPAVLCDLADPDSAGPALAGVTKVFLYAEPRGVDGFVERAVAAGVEHVVLLSALLGGGTEEEDAIARVQRKAEEEDAIARMHREAEAVVAGSGVAWTFVRPGAFATNTLSWAASVRAEGVVRDPFPDAHSAPVHEADIAAVAARALTEPGHEGAVYELTGPESVTRRRQAELIGEAIGRPVGFVVQDLAEHREELSRWTSPEVADSVIRHSQDAVGRPAATTDTVEKVTGEPARAYGRWARDHAADFTG